MYGIVLIAILVVMGGAIAFIGDKLGSKVGKKKLTIFGLRPKYTSIIVTIITGIFITAATLGVVTVASENVRVALFGMEKLNHQIRSTEQSLAQVSDELLTANQERRKTLENLQQVQQDYQEAENDLSKSRRQVEELEQVKAELQAAQLVLDERIDSLNQEKGKLENDIGELKNIALSLGRSMQFVREGEIVYRADEVIMTAVISYTEEKSADAIGTELIDVLKQANRIVLDRLKLKEEIEVIWVSQKQLYDAVALIEQQQQDMVVRISSSANIVYGESVRVDMELYPNKLVFKSGELIHSGTFTLSAQGRSEAEKTVVNFLKEVNAAATAKGIIPDPLSGAVGVVNAAKFYDAASRLEDIKGVVLISAYAAEDTYVNGPLKPRLKIELLTRSS